VTLRVRWMGVDMGECLMDVTPRRAHLLAGDTSKALGQPERAAVRCHRWRVMAEKYGSVPVMLERHKDELIRYVFDAEPDAGRLFLETELEYLDLAAGAAEALAYLRAQGVELSVVTAAKSGPGSIEESCEYRFLVKHDVLKYFDSLISPRGKFRVKDWSFDRRYEGTSKEEGTIYDVLAEDIAARGIPVDQALMMGDKEWTDIAPAKARGFKTILYTGYVCRGPTEADLVVERFSDVTRLVEGLRHGG
jgi:FMN phosphatase YigB (HAD superfamily)